MKAGKWKKLFDPYQWLPPHGENAVKFRSDGKALTLRIVYDSTGARSGKRPGELAREFVFRSVCAFYTASFPGASLLAIEPQFEDGKPDFGWLIEYTDSEAARAWQLHFASSKRIIKHYQIAFLSENQLCVVFAGDVTLS